MTLKLRYKPVDSDISTKMEFVVGTDYSQLDDTSDNFRFAAAVAEFGLLLKNSKYNQDAIFEDVLELADGALGPDVNGYRTEFIQLVEKAESLN